MRIFFVVSVATALQASALASQAAASPYAGEERRPIKALSDEEIRAYLNGEGFGLAKAAELNRYPGPRHVLDLARELELTDAQRALVQAIRDSMSAGAVRLGKEIVARERALDSAFANRSIDAAGLRAAVLEISRLQGELRTVHLAAHLATSRALTAQQVERYQELRGYGTTHGAHPH